MKSFTEMKQTALKAVPDADACFDCGGALQFCRSSAERGFGENEVMIDKQTGNAMPFFMAVDQGLLTMARPVRLSLETGQPLEAGDADAEGT